MASVIHQINLSPGGVPKTPVPEARITRTGLVGDVQKNTKHHGGPERAVCLFSLEVIRRLQAEGHPIEPGSTGDNLTVAGMDWAVVRPGVLLKIGDGIDAVELEVASYTKPCATIRNSFTDFQFKRIAEERHPGESRVYARVIREGVVRVGDVCRVIGNMPRPDGDEYTKVTE